ncbi:thiamine pyrophosphate-binding protein [Thioalkalivibrio paradoxus]|uniref:Thiamine pyrophosphate enzyme N-terminal TPP-binding domain-containing protein n=1 Tax=Thioalkalivibrio paradoxus ARh 1 TaxID=713585 RepID=W0DNP2_9GAMM|nr:thiamine pyrophosphate-binding protein [Thioalkalivibrio paradoxus]AHF00185.1 hypothetical protein THITH_11590 [Thioalkalivibrio paradoxus ARh 1]
MKASDLFVKALESESVEYVFGIPGEGTVDLFESLWDQQVQKRLVIQCPSFCARRLQVR